MTSNLIAIQASEYLIKSVTVSKSSRAEVVRTFPIDLKRGRNKLEIRGLPSDIYAVRTSGLGSATRLDDFLCTVGRDKSAVYVEGSAPEVVRALSVKKAALESEKTIRAQELQVLSKYAQTLSGEHFSPKQLSEFLQSYVDQSRKIVQATAELDEKIVQIVRQIDEQNMSARQGQAWTRIDAIINSDLDASVTLVLTYIVSNCSWDATYELHTTTEDGKPSSSVSLHYLATVRQRTGEDWTDAALTLSTNQTTTAPQNLPRLGRLQIRPGPGSGFGMYGGETVKFGVPSFPPNSGAQAQAHAQGRGELFGGAGRGLNNFNSTNAATAPFGATRAQNVGLAFGAAQTQNVGPAFGAAQTQNVGPAFGAAQTQNVVPAFGAAQNVRSIFGAAQKAVGPFGATANAGGPGAVLFGTTSQTAVPVVPVEGQLAQQPTMPEGEGEDDYDVMDEEGTPGSMVQPTTVVKETPLMMTFTVTDRANIPSDGLAHQVTLAVLPLEAKISHITIPRNDPTVFLQCEFKNSSEYRLLTGPVNVIIDDSYMSTTSLATNMNPGDSFVCLLGTDPSTKVTYTRSSKTVKSDGGAFSENTNTTTYTTKISIHNKHAFDIADLVVLDSVPTTEDKRVKVILHKPIGLAETADGQSINLDNGLRVGWETLVDGKGGKTEGKFTWKWKVASGATVNLLTQYDVRVPRDTPWVLSNIQQSS